MRKALNTRFVATVKAPPQGRAEYVDTVAPGLALRVGPRAKTWVALYKTKGGAVRRQTLGRADTLSLQEARAAARDALRDAQAGKDPAADKRARQVETFAALADLFIERHAKKTKRTWAEDVRILRKDLLPAWGEVPVRTMTRRSIREHMDAIADRAPVAANRALALLSSILNFGVDREWLDSNPAYRLKKPTDEASRDRVLTDVEVRQLWCALDEAEAAYRAIADSPQPRRDGAKPRVTRGRLGASPLLRPMFADWMRLRLLTAQRGGEVIRMRWIDVSKVDGRRVWTIPAEVAKNGRQHAVPLSPSAVAILARRRRATDRGVPWVFPNDLNRAPAIDRAKKLNLSMLLPGSSDVRGHDLRRTAASGLARLGTPRETIAHVLNHVDRGPRATAVYDRFDRLPEKRRALDAWERDLRRIVTGTTPGKVVSIGR